MKDTTLKTPRKGRDECVRLEIAVCWLEVEDALCDLRQKLYEAKLTKVLTEREYERAIGQIGSAQGEMREGRPPLKSE